MDIHSLTYIYDDSENIISKLYLQFDGYPRAIGSDLASYLTENKEKDMETLADELVRHFFNKQKDSAKVFPRFLFSQFNSEEWEYHIYTDKVKIVHDSDRVYVADWRDESFSDLCKTLEKTEQEAEERFLKKALKKATKSLKKAMNKAKNMSIA